MICSRCQVPLHPYDLERLFVVPAEGGRMREDIFCAGCAKALRRTKSSPEPVEPARVVKEPEWYHCLLSP